MQAYFNQHIFQFEQSKPYGILRLIDEESNINNGTDESMLDKLNCFLKNNEYYEIPQKRESAFTVAHYAGKVKYQIAGFREKNKDLMRQDVLMTIKKSKSAFVRGLVGDDPVAVFRWNMIRATFQAVNAFRQAGKLMAKADSMEHLNLPQSANATLKRVGSDVHLSAFLRGEITPELVPDFCDTSFFKTIATHARKPPGMQAEDRHSALKTLQCAVFIVYTQKLASF
ncbi:unnamed protein product [Gongylonema pulchrum]|uniref:Myosin motor domain-containing protein n=1 Tax=Gongylonema pulchrum TaxID=637853 RepID=A0A3P6QLV8_9BILA|nr:unnamed protein product [Gongylonema pulchrum]